MLDKFLDDYVNKMYLNSNINMSLEQRNLYKKDDYYVLLKPVVVLLKKYPDYSLEELRNKLFEESGLREKIKKFIYEDKMTPGAVITYGTNDYRETLVIGNREEVVFKNGKIIPSIKEMTYDTIFYLSAWGAAPRLGVGAEPGRMAKAVRHTELLSLQRHGSQRLL